MKVEEVETRNQKAAGARKSACRGRKPGRRTANGIHAHAPNFRIRRKGCGGRRRGRRWRGNEVTEGDRVYTADSLTGTYAIHACNESNWGSFLIIFRSNREPGFGHHTRPHSCLIQKASAKSGETVLVSRGLWRGWPCAGSVGVAAGLNVIVRPARRKGGSLFGITVRPLFLIT